MKVLHLPFNISSQMSITVRALRQRGVEARGLARLISPLQDYEGVETMVWSGKPNPFARLVRGLRWRIRMVRAMAWADIIHWHWGDTTWRGLDLRLAAAMGKPRLVEFWGSDLRDGTLAARDNPFLARMYAEYPELAEEHSDQAQRMFQQNGFECLIPSCELTDYVKPEFFPTFHQTRTRLFADEYTPRFPDPSKKRPCVAHAPSQKQRKGTEAVLRAVERLAATKAFEFKLIYDLPRSQALKVVADCDVFLDQFTIGAEGLAAHEAMALGKPVICYIKPALLCRYPPEFPVIAADQNNLESTLGSLLENGPRRHELGRLGRKYIEKYHDAPVVVGALVKLYEGLLLRAGKS